MGSWARWLTGVGLLGATCGVFLLLATGTVRVHDPRGGDGWAERAASGELPAGTWPSEFTGPGHAVGADTPARLIAVSPDGRTYLIASDFPGGYHGFPEASPRFVTARCAEDARPPRLDPGGAATRAAYRSLVGSRDEVLGEGACAGIGYPVFVLDDGRFVQAARFSVDASLLSLLDRHGRPLWQLSGLDLFGDDFEQAGFLDSSTLISPRPWCKALWHHAPAAAAIVIGWDDRIVAVDLQSGRTVTLDNLRLAVLEGLDRSDVTAKEAILDLARRQRWAEALAPARRLVDDLDRPLAERFRAALVLLAHEDRTGRDAVQAMATDPAPSRARRDDFLLAWGALGPILGEEAPAVAHRILQQADAPSDALRGALACLASSGSQAAIDDLLDWVAERAPAGDALFVATDPLMRLRDGVSWETRYAPGLSDRDQLVSQWSALRTGDVGALAAALQPGRKRSASGPQWTEFVPAILRDVSRRPLRSFAVPVREFCGDFAAHPDGTPEWQALVLREADAALAACAAAP